MSSFEYIAHKCTRQLENNQLNKFTMYYEGKEYTIIFKQFNDNPNDFIIFADHN